MHCDVLCMLCVVLLFCVLYATTCGMCVALCFVSCILCYA